MDSFLDFIKNDIESKKTFLFSIPTNNKTNIKKYNESIASIYENYVYYKESVLKYIEAKSESFECKKESKVDEKLLKQFDEYKHMKDFLNPMNTFKEKLGLDALLYDIHHYSNFTFENINKTIENIIEKFRMAGIVLKSDDFKYTCYVNEYMTEFFMANGNYDKLSNVFEQIYWHNPNIIEHIELNFRKLIKKYQKEFEQYVSKEKEDLLARNKFNDIVDLDNALKKTGEELLQKQDESLYDIIQMAKESKIEINNYFPDNKFRITAFANLTINETDYSDDNAMDKLLTTLSKLKSNALEYANYLKFLPLFNDFKEKYQKESSIESNASALKTVESQISTKESKLESINNKIFGESPTPILGLFEKRTPDYIKKMKIEAINLAKELYDLYYEEDRLKFENNILSLKNDSLFLVSDVIKLYYSFTFFERETLASVFGLTDYNEIINLCNEFEEFATNPNNVIVSGINIFEDNDVASIICNKYRLENINIELADLDENSISALINKIDFVFRIHKIEHSKLSVEKIWFIVQNKKIQEKEKKEKQQEEEKA